MYRIAAAALALAAFATAPACKGGGASCDDLVDHVSKLSGIEFKGDLRKAALDKCEKQPAATRDCAMKADSMEALQACK